MSADSRREPDALLTRIQRKEANRRRRRLNTFPGAAAGVGKTYTMLLAAREQHAEWPNVVVETENRAAIVAPA